VYCGLLLQLFLYGTVCLQHCEQQDKDDSLPVLRPLGLFPNLRIERETSFEEGQVRGFRQVRRVLQVLVAFGGHCPVSQGLVHFDGRGKELCTDREAEPQMTNDG
jgi:hypothetical protein